MWNFEWAVRPPSISKAAIPEVATHSTILPSERSLALMTFQRKVFPVPPGPSTKKHLPFFS
ncbi:hypothetical protein LINPERHAP2_LOCUS7253 [Linum perenne]